MFTEITDTMLKTEFQGYSNDSNEISCKQTTSLTLIITNRIYRMSYTYVLYIKMKLHKRMLYANG